MVVGVVLERDGTVVTRVSGPGRLPLLVGGCPGPLVWVCCGGVLLSHNLSVAVPLALPGLASRFGMEAGRFPGAVTTTSFVVQSAPPVWGVWVDRGSYSGCGRVLSPVGGGVCCLVLAH